ncbi:hypothetical protein Tco_0260614 [Tanacetum coccineum]
MMLSLRFLNGHTAIIENTMCCLAELSRIKNLKESPKEIMRVKNEQDEGKQIQRTPSGEVETRLRPQRKPWIVDDDEARCNEGPSVDQRDLDPDSDFSEQSSDDIPNAGEGMDSDLEDT